MSMNRLRERAVRRVVRRDGRAAIVEEVAFRATGDALLFTGRHRPSTPPRGGLVVCSPVLAEFTENYRFEVLLGRSLAERGILVERFHYRGTGHSDDEPGGTTFASMQRDARDVTARVEQDLGGRPVAFLGTRLGAFVAASVAREHGSAPVALWEPVLDGRRFFREISRARRIFAMRPGAGASGGSLADEIAAGGAADVLGHELTAAMFDSFSRVHLEHQMGTPGSLLLVQIAGSTELRDEYRALAEALRAGGCSVRTEHVAGRDSWWFADDAVLPPERRPGTSRLIRVTGDWVAGAVSRGSSR